MVRLRPEDRWILPVLADYAGSLVADGGGTEAMTPGAAQMIELAQLARGPTMLVMAETARGDGIVGFGGAARCGAKAPRSGMPIPTWPLPSPGS